MSSQDYDGVDFQLGHEVNCSAMSIRDIKLAVYSYMEIIDVRFNNASLQWQLTPNTPYSSWLWILGVDYRTTDLGLYQPVSVTVTVAGGSPQITELCPASSDFFSSSSCEYIIAGTTGSDTGVTGGDYDACCPKSSTSYYSPQRLQLEAGIVNQASK